MQCSRCRFDPWVRKVPGRRAWQPIPVFLPGESHGQRSLAGYSPWGLKELDTTEWLNSNNYYAWFLSSPTRDPTHAPCTGRQSIKHSTGTVSKHNCFKPREDIFHFGITSKPSLTTRSNFQIHELSTHTQLSFPSGSDIKEDACNTGDPGCILGLRDSPGEGNGNALWCSCLENCMDRGKWVRDSPWGHQESDTTGWLTLDTVTSLSS